MIAPLVVMAALLGQAGAGEAPPAPPSGEGSDWVGLPGESSGASSGGGESALHPEVSGYGNLPIPPTIEEAIPGAPSQPRPEPPNLTSLHGAIPLGRGRRAAAVELGFPVLGVQALMGLSRGFDLGVSYETLYGLMHDVRAEARLHLLSAGTVAFGLTANAGAAFFLNGPAAELHGPRWLTGRRNFNATLGPILSVQGSEPRAMRFFASARLLLVADTQPYQLEPLGGTPGPVVLSGNLLTEAGLEVPVSEWISLAFQLGLDFHGRADDSPVMVGFAAGVVSALP